MAGPLVNIGLAVWLVVTTLFGPHGPWQPLNALVAGALIFAGAVAALYGRAWGQYLAAASGAWLVLSPMVFAAPDLFAQLNPSLVGTAVAVIALWPAHTEGEPLLTTIGVLGENG